jgi:DNA-binding transcriptional regulator YdaS (Cro superfamily)
MAKSRKIWNGDADWVHTPTEPVNKGVYGGACARPTRQEVRNTPLHNLIYDLGGCQQVGRALGINASSVSRWTAPASHGGGEGCPTIARLEQLFQLGLEKEVDFDKLDVLRGCGLDI